MKKQNYIELKDINFFYKKNKYILKNLNAKFFPGEITAILGANGCGKTTLIKILAGIMNPYSGNIKYLGEEVNKKNILKYKEKIGFMPEFLNLYQEMSILNLMKFLMSLKKKTYDEKKIFEILKLVNLDDKKYKKIKSLSKGMKQRLNLAQSIIIDPKIILFDEPSNGFDCTSIEIFYNILKKLSNQGSIIIISSHHLYEIQNNVDKILIISKGNIAKEVRKNDFEKGNENEKKICTFYTKAKINEKNIIELKNNFPEIKIKNNNIITCKVYQKDIFNLISEIHNRNIIYKNINILNIELENKLKNI